MKTNPKAQIAFRSINTLVLCCSLLVASHFCILSATASDYAAPVSLALKEAGKLYDSGHFASAKMQFYEALRMEPNCPDAYNGLGLCAAKEGRMPESVECYKKALQLKPDFYNSLYNLANNYYIQNNYSEAISFYAQALDASKNKGDDKKSRADLLSSLASVYRARAGTLQGDPQQ
ncbi:MAG: tetratricopeptide repeat protein, partial [Candidatus Obscuribacterales bacterium]|nr:tetratricopeptide repeat protein [Candidatus Obscuribacterales bacterium]